MGTRVDFYAGDEWLGSYPFDGYPDGVPKDIGLCACKTEADFRAVIGEFLARKDNASTPQTGWPWPWADSRTTDYAYRWSGGQVWCYCFGQPDDESTPEAPPVEWPDMREQQRVTLGPRSGLVVFSRRTTP